jgi:hypothetical protein
MRVDPTLKRHPDEGCWVVFRPFPISRDGNVQLDEGLGLGQSAGGLRMGLDVAGQMLPEFSVEFLGRAGIGEWGG